jgi:hypothetical protein
MKASTSIILMLLPIAFGTWASAFPEVGPVPLRIAVWTCLSLACLVWGVLIRRQQPTLGWCCIIVCCLQAFVVLLPAFMPPGKTRTSTAVIWPTALFVLCPLAGLLFIVRLICAPFSSKILEQVRRHPIIHSLWACFAFVGVLVFVGALNPSLWPPPSVERRDQRHELLARVQTVGGWEAVRRGCEALVTNYPDGLNWFPPCSNAWVYPNPQTEPHRYYVTNIDYGPLPPAVAALRPREIEYYPLKMLREFPKEPQVTVVRIKVFGGHSTGGHSTPYYGLEVPCGEGADGYTPRPSRGGASGNRYTTYGKVADRVFEIY